MSGGAKPAFHYLFCNHWTQGGIGYSFPAGRFGGRRYEKTFSTVYTIEKMLDAAARWPGLVVTMELDAFAYEAVAEEAPETIARLKTMLADGRAGIEGGTYGQPLGQDFGAESNLRQLTYGRSSILDTLDYSVRAFLVEEQWFHPQLPQLLKTSGYRYACLQAQNSGQVCPMRRDIFGWRGIDGTTVPTIPSNDLQVSCVRQYTDYAPYRERLARYDDPLLFQWVEVWTPGMDWGASAMPFEKAIEQVFAEGGKPTTLQGYFEEVLPDRDLETVAIPLDDSNYGNDWYQAGGWGYDGDVVIQFDTIAEHAVLHLETLACLLQPGDLLDDRLHALDDDWRRLMILQNHDFSVARNYNVFTEDGILTENGYLAQAGYRALTKDLRARAARCAGTEGEWAVFNHTDCAGKRVFAPRPGTLAEIDLPALGWQALRAANTVDDVPPEDDTRRIADDRFEITWKPGSWEVEIIDRKQGIRLSFAGVSGRIGKVNEHDRGSWPALSPGHQDFSFAFDGTRHAPDQVAADRVTSHVQRRTAIRSTLVLGCDLLTLHTTDTPVSRAEIRIHLDHRAQTVSLEVDLYFGVWTSLEHCRAIFTHDIAEARHFRDYAFGEEEAHIEAVYPLSYTRLARQDNAGLQIVHTGSRRAYYHRSPGGGRVEYLLARDKVRGEYRFDFTLVFDDADAATATRRARFLTMPIEPISAGRLADRLPAGRNMARFDDPAIVITSVSSTAHVSHGMSAAMTTDHGGGDARYIGDGPHLIVRAVNMSERNVMSPLALSMNWQTAQAIEATGAIIEAVDPEAGVTFGPHAMKTLAFSLV